MNCFVDTSGFYAMLDADDAHHPAAQAEWDQLLLSETVLVTSSYVLVETLALMQHRLGLDAVRLFHAEVFPLLRVEWVEGGLHESGLAGVLGARRTKLSVVDCVSFAVMRRLGLRDVFTFDTHFKEQNFICHPRR